MDFEHPIGDMNSVIGIALDPAADQRPRYRRICRIVRKPGPRPPRTSQKSRQLSSRHALTGRRCIMWHSARKKRKRSIHRRKCGRSRPAELPRRSLQLRRPFYVNVLFGCVPLRFVFGRLLGGRPVREQRRHPLRVIPQRPSVCGPSLDGDDLPLNQ